MKIINSLFLSLMLVAVAFASTGTFKTDEISDELAAMYAKIDKAVMSKDLDALSALLANDYEKHEGAKTLNRAEAIAEMKKNLDVVKSVESSKTTIDKIQQVEGNYIVDYTMTGKITVVGSDGKENSMTVSSKGRDWWVKGDDGKWMCVAAESIE